VNTHTKAKTSKKTLRIIENVGQIGACTDLRDIFGELLNWYRMRKNFGVNYQFISRNWNASVLQLLERDAFPLEKFMIRFFVYPNA